MKVNETVKLLESGGARTLMAQLYGEDGVGANVKRYEDLLAGYEKMFGGEGDEAVFLTRQNGNQRQSYRPQPRQGAGRQH